MEGALPSGAVPAAPVAPETAGSRASEGRGALGDPAGPARCHVEDGLAIGVSTAHDAEITEDTVVSAWYGERLDPDYAIAVCFANARTEQEKRAGREQAQEDVFRPKSWSDGDFSTTVEYIRRYYDEHPAA